MKTAMQELIEFLTTHCNPTFCDVEYSDFILAIEKAKEIEKQQIIEAHGKKEKKSGGVTNYTYILTGEDYYNEIYKNK